MHIRHFDLYNTMKLLLVLALLVAAAAAGRYVDLQSRTPRIVGGSPVTIESVPWQAALVQRRFQGDFGIYCGGSVISSYHVLGAAHCFPGASQGLLPAVEIRVGSHNLNFGGTLVGLANATNHPDYDSWTLDFDIAVIFLQTPVFLGPTVQTLELAHPTTQLTDGLMLIVTGFGHTQHEGEQSDVLLRVDVPVFNWAECRARYIYLGTIDPRWADTDLTLNQFCAGWLNQDACQGDSGGAAAAGGVALGVVSWGFECANPFWPGVYALVAPATEWIVSVAN